MKASIIAAIASVAAVQAGHCEEEHAKCLLSVELPSLLSLDLLCGDKYDECCSEDHDDEPSTTPGLPVSTTSTFTTKVPVTVTDCPEGVYDCEPTVTETEIETSSICSLTSTHTAPPVIVTTTSTITVSKCAEEVTDCPYEHTPTVVTSTFTTHAPPPNTLIPAVEAPAAPAPPVQEAPAVPEAPSVEAPAPPAVPVHEAPAVPEAPSVVAPPYEVPGTICPTGTGSIGTVVPTSGGVAYPTEVPGAGSEIPIGNSGSSVQAGSMAALLIMAGVAVMM